MFGVVFLHLLLLVYSSSGKDFTFICLIGTAGNLFNTIINETLLHVFNQQPWNLRYRNKVPDQSSSYPSMRSLF